MMALCKQIKDPLTQRKAQTHVKNINQGCRGLAVYNQEFRELVCRLTN